MGAHFQVSGLGNREPATGDQVQVRAPALSIPPSVIDSAICHLPSIQSSVHLRCQVTAPGASAIRVSAVGLRQSAPGSSGRYPKILTANRLPLTPAPAYPFSPQFSPQRSPPFSHPSSAIDSVIRSFRVAGGSPGWRVAGLFQFSPQRSPPFSPPLALLSLNHLALSPKPSFLSLCESPAPHRI